MISVSIPPALLDHICWSATLASKQLDHILIDSYKPGTYYNRHPDAVGIIEEYYNGYMTGLYEVLQFCA